MTTKQKFSSLRLEDWPAYDRDLWMAAQKKAGIFDEAGFAADWQPTTLRSLERGYGLYLSWLAQRHNLDQDAAPVDRVDQDWIKTFLNAYAPGRSELTVAAAVRGIAYVVRATNPPDGQPWLTKLAHRMTNTAVPSRPKLPRMSSVAELEELGRHLMRAGWKDLQMRKISGAQIFRNGLMIAALIARPEPRRRNFAALRINHSFLRDQIGVRVRFLKDETKKGRDIDFHYPGWLTRPFDVYVNDIRPLLQTRSSVNDEGWLWIGQKGEPLRPHSVTGIVTKTTKQHLGKPVSPHLFRDIAATDIALLDPGHVGITKSVLGHASLSSSQKSYNQATSFSAVMRLDAVLEGLMED
ncbi:site-specific integrase [Ollibium composti]|uniref:Uncharacterized protein n=1 Tax=Ollibium composti TaxID=2675109 RepID=A0ABY2Q224_9HYPH|nr:site-specific integrase [Mesorhizobium composti]THF54649.1 hypothetical protein E6C48_21325 [Mesorhizobium composti]